MVFQDARLFPHLSVRGQPAATACAAAPRGAAGPASTRWSSCSASAPLLARRPHTCRAANASASRIGRALLAQPHLLLMDEPLASLDPRAPTEVLPFLARLRDASRLPILYVTHALEEVDALADTLVLLEAGRVTAAGPVEALAARADLPALARRRDAGALLPCTVLTQDSTRGLTRLGFAGGELLVPLRPGLAEGARLRVRLRARDVAVATEPPHGISMHNVLPCTLAGIDPAGVEWEVFLRLAVGPTPLLARVTRDSVARLALTPGMPLWALVKSVAFDHAGPP